MVTTTPSFEQSLSHLPFFSKFQPGSGRNATASDQSQETKMRGKAASLSNHRDDPLLPKDSEVSLRYGYDNEDRRTTQRFSKTTVVGYPPASVPSW